MSLNFKPATKDHASLMALAASGSTSFAKAAQAEIQKRQHDALRRARAL